MSGKRFIPPYLVFDNHSLAADTTSHETDVMGLDYCHYDIAWGGSSPVGTITVEYLKDGDAGWATLDLGSTISVSGNSGSHRIIMLELPFKKLRLKYTRTSGTGVISTYLTAKAR